MSALSVALVSRDNGVGLSADMGLLEAILVAGGHHVTRVEWSARAMPRVDVAIFLELWSRRLAAFARRTVGVFNLEWFQTSWQRDLAGITQLWAKSEDALNVYRRLGLRSASYTGFAARDLHDPSVTRTPTALHLRGHSDLKNTQAVIDCWRRDPKLPPLTIISAVPLEVPAHVRLLGRISDAELRTEMNRATLHICPSRAEGWGHYIAEGLSVGALVVTMDASPMREHVQPDRGVLITPSIAGRRGLVAEYGVSVRQLGEAVRHAAAIPERRRAIMSARAREHFALRNAEFAETALSLLARIDHAPERNSPGRAGRPARPSRH